MSTNAARHLFLDDLASDAELTGTVLRKAVRGRDNIRRVIDTVGKLYASQSPALVTDIQGLTYFQYNAKLRNGLELKAVAVIERNDDGTVPRVNVSISPLAAVLSLSAQLGAQLEQEIGAEHFL